MRSDKTRTLTAAAVALAFSIAGCSSSGPEIDDPDDVSPYKLRTTPENVLYNMTVAYREMDADQYLACLSDSVVFHLNPADVNNPDDPLPPYWGKDEEETIHRNMFAEESDVVSVTLALATADVDYVPGPGGGSRWLYREDVDLRVTVTDVPENTTYHATAPSEFLFQVDPNEVGPQGEPLWEIIHWWDMSTIPSPMHRPGDLGENSSWGTIKALYR